MFEPLKPASEQELRQMIAEAVAITTPLAPVGHGTKSGIGYPVNHVALDLSGLAGVVLYEPDELILTVHAGTPVDEVVALLAEHGQELPFEPPVWTRPDGGASRGTIGGMVMTNFSGPRRIKVGAVRDHVLGLKGVSGRAEHFKAGGRVVKNVTGYDLARGLCGSWGTLAIVTEVTFKVLPKAETVATVVITGLDLAAAVRLMSDAMQSPFDVSGAICRPNVVDRSGRTSMSVFLRIEGFAPSVAARVEGLSQLARKSGQLDIYDEMASCSLWDGVGQSVPPRPAETGARWRVSIAPASAVAFTEWVVATLPRQFDPARFEYDWAGGLVSIEVDGDLPDLGAAAIRAAVASAGGGHATLMRGPDDKRATIDVFEPQPPALARLSARLKAQFDPKGILNPGRMVRGS